MDANLLGAGDVLKTGSPQLCSLYNYGNDDTALFVFPPGGNNWQQVWRSGKGNWAWDANLLGAGDVLKTGSPQLCSLYNYGNDDTALFVFPPGGNNWQQVWRSGKGNWAWDANLTEFTNPLATHQPVPQPGPVPQLYCVQAFDDDGDFVGQLTIQANSYADAENQASDVIGELGGDTGFVADGPCGPISLPSNFGANVLARNPHSAKRR